MNVIERLKKLKPNKNLDIFDIGKLSKGPIGVTEIFRPAAISRNAVAQMNFESTAMMHSGVAEAMANMIHAQDINRVHMFNDSVSGELYRYNLAENRWDKV